MAPRHQQQEEPRQTSEQVTHDSPRDDAKECIDQRAPLQGHVGVGPVGLDSMWGGVSPLPLLTSSVQWFAGLMRGESAASLSI